MILKGVIASILIASAMLSGSAYGAAILDDSSKNGPRFLGGFVIGNELTIGGVDVAVNFLGVWDQGSDGLAASHQVGVWDAGGALVASTTVPSGTSALLDDSYRYAALAQPIALLAGQTYRIGALYENALDPFNDPWDPDGDGNPANSPAVGDGVAVTPGAGVATINGDYFAASAVLANPSSFGGGTPGRWGAANALFVVVPEPTTLVLVMGLGVVVVRRRNRFTSS